MDLMDFVVGNRLVFDNQRGMLRAGLIRISGGNSLRNFVTPEYAMNYLHEGSGEYIYEDGRRYPLKPGSVLRRFPGVRHSVNYHSPGIVGVVALPAQAWELFKLTGLPKSSLPVFQVEPDDNLPRMFSAIGKDLQDGNGPDLSEMLLRMMELMLELHRRELGTADALKTTSLIVKAMSILSKDIAERNSIPEIAPRLNMSYSQFRKLFREQVGMSPGLYRVQRRIRKAMDLLMTPKTSLCEVSERLGYPDVYTFSRQFKKVTAMAPGAWRKTVGQK